MNECRMAGHWNWYDPNLVAAAVMTNSLLCGHHFCSLFYMKILPSFEIQSWSWHSLAVLFLIFFINKTSVWWLVVKLFFFLAVLNTHNSSCLLDWLTHHKYFSAAISTRLSWISNQSLRGNWSESMMIIAVIHFPCGEKL